MNDYSTLFDSNNIYDSVAIDKNGYHKRPWNGGNNGKGSIDLDTIATGSVIFIDYDGTIIATYTADEVQNLTALPANPEHEELIAQGWNWNLEQLKYYLNKYPEEIITVGQMYTTIDGATHIHMNVENRLTISLCFQQSVENGVILDWGDGSDPETVAGTGVVTIDHTYASEGEYVLRMKAINGCTIGFGNGSTVHAVNNVEQITKIHFSEDINENGFSNAFGGCCALKYLTIPEGVTSIDSNAFGGCYALKYLTIPEGVTSIGGSAFGCCISIMMLSIPEGVTSIGGNAFSGCYALKYLTIPEEVTSIGQQAFSYCYKLQSLTIPEGVTSIENNTFDSCFALKYLTISEGVTSIGSRAFGGCYALKYLTIPDGVTSIGSTAFTSCQVLSSIIIPDGVTSIGSSAFGGCHKLFSLILKPETPPTLASTSVFNSIPNDCVIYVPKSTLTAYQTATNWSTWASQMVEIE